MKILYFIGVFVLYVLASMFVLWDTLALDTWTNLGRGMWLVCGLCISYVGMLCTKL